MIYRAEGRGTKFLATNRENEIVDVLGPLGNGFPVEAAKPGQTALLVGGGIGVPPLHELAKQLNARGVKTIHVLGFQSEDVCFYEEQFNALGDTYYATVDGSKGTKGFVTTVFDEVKPGIRSVLFMWAIADASCFGRLLPGKRRVLIF